MKKTKIVATIGPASDTRTVLKQMISKGMDVARLNMSHGSHNRHQLLINVIRSVSTDIPIMADLKGPELRIVNILNPFSVKKNEIIKLSGTNSRCLRVNYEKLHKVVKKGNIILVDDGNLTLKVTDIKKDIIYAKAKNNYELKQNRKVTIPNAKLDIAFPSIEDKQDIAFALKHKLEYIALSFIKTQHDIEKARALVKNTETKLIAKIETVDAVKNIDTIIDASDGIMIARGDLGVELPAENVPFIQKEIVLKCNQKGKPVITATQMLESMITNPRPTRAETSDVANAILDGTDAIMLSGESAVGKHPVDAVATMTRIAKKVEPMVTSQVAYKSKSISEEISNAAYHFSRREFIDCVIITTTSGFSARMVSRFKPKKPIVAVTHSKVVQNQLRLIWGIKPLTFSKKVSSKITIQAIKECIKHKLVSKSDVVVITGGIGTVEAGHSNVIEIHRVKNVK